MSFLKKILSISALVIAALVLGCGGSEPSITKAEFIQQGDRICKKGESRKSEKFEVFMLKKKLGPKNPITIAEQQELVTAVILPPVRRVVEELDELPRPEGEEEKVDAIVGGADEVVSDLEKNPLPLVTPKSKPFEDVTEQAKKFGFKQCYVYY